jgi:PEP-CTERM/exosortase A-associated glycosyltransferase
MSMRETRRLKILHILDHSLPFHSGYALRTYNILRAQARLGWQPVALTSPEHNRITQTNETEYETIEGFRYYRSRAACKELSQMSRTYKDAPVLSRRLGEVVAIEHPDILHVHSPVYNAWPVLWIRMRTGIPVVYEVRAFWEDASMGQRRCRPRSWRYQLTAAMEKWVCRKADQVAVLCRGLKSDLIQRGISRDKITMVFNGVDLDDFQACPLDREFLGEWKLEGKQVIGFIGSFFQYEGLDLLIDAMAQLAATRPNLALLLVGAGRMEARLKEQVRRRGLCDRVIVPGRIPHERIAGVYALIDILVYPRYSMRLTELVTPLKPLEAMAMGKPVVASDIGGHREMIEHGNNGLLFAAGNVNALAEALRIVLDDPHLRRNLVAQASRCVAKHSWHETVALYDDVYNRALTRRKSPRWRLDGMAVS